MSTSPTSSSSTSLPDLLVKFSHFPHADIILRSSDSHDFRVQKFYVVDSSPVLGEQIMATTSHGVGLEASCDAITVDGEIKDEPLLPVIQLSESHAIISSLLTFVFPVIPVLPPTIEQILELISVAEKYEMTTALIRIRDCASRRDPSLFCRETALQVYSFARKNGLLKEALEAAEETLKSPMTIPDLEDELDIIPGVALHELWEYRQRVLENIFGGLNIGFDSSEVYRILSDADLDCAVIGQHGIPQWLDEYLYTVQEDPACLDITTFHLALYSHVSSDGDGCQKCTSMSAETIREFWTALTVAVRDSTRIAESDFSLTEGKIRFQGSTSATAKASPLLKGLSMQGADVILRSSDLVSFRVHKSILAISSPFFDDMFSLPQPRDDEVVDGLPIVCVSEDAEVLHSLLTVLYPIPSVIPDSYEKSLALLAVLQKYDMSTVLSIVRSEVGHQPPTTEAAFRAYAIAYGKDLIPEMEASARLTLEHPMTFQAIADALPLFEGSALSDLVRFRKRSCDKLLSFIMAFLSGSDGLSEVWFGCNKTERTSTHPRDYDTSILSVWLRDLLSQLAISLKTYTNPLPKPSSLREQVVTFLQAHISRTNCRSCPTVYAMEGEALHNHLYRGISKGRDEVPFQLDTGVPNTSKDLRNAEH